MFRFTKKPAFRDYLLWLALLIYTAVLVWVLVTKSRPDLILLYRNTEHPSLSIAAECILGITYVYLLFTGVLCCFYRPYPTEKNNRKLPSCTIIVPAYNEGAHVEQTLQSLLKSDYPKEKLEIIAINDGSEDDTWEYIKKGATQAPDLIRTINLPVNCGKKYAIYVGTKKASGDIIVTVDSDSFVEAHTIRALVSPLRDKTVGAVAGSVQAANRDQNFIAALLDVLMVFACEFLRAAQSVSGLVLCTPGALSAYRKSALLPIIDEWLNQTFMGKPATIGEDRALATLILRSNYKTLQQRTALVRTYLPSTASVGLKTMMRWARGDIRENIVMTKFTIDRLRHFKLQNFALLIYWVAFIQNLILPFLFIPSFVFMLLFSAKNAPVFLATNGLMSLLWATIPAAIYATHTSLRKAAWAFLYGLICPFLMALIYIYCFMTLRDSRWMTRSLPQREKEKLLHN